LLQTARLNDVDPQAWLTDVLTQIVGGHIKQNHLASLLPWNWKAAGAAAASDTS
jgi:transposase